jgi:C4-dicarboxylate transporter DctM subunit
MILLAVLFGSLLLLIMVGIPIFVSMLMVGVGYLFFSGENMQIVSSIMFNSLNKFPLMAAPFFILAGNLLSGGKIGKYLIDLANDFFGRFTGGLAIAATVAYTALAAMTGVSIAAIASIAPIVVPGMTKSGYKEGFSTAVCCAGGCLAPLIPPSLTLILYGAIGELSIGTLFIAGIVPGIMLAIFIIIYIWARSRQLGIKGVTASWKQRWGSLRRGIALLTLPVAILGGIYGGFVTPTESAALAVLYTAFLALVVYRTIRLRDLPRIFMESMLVVGSIFVILASASVMAYILSLKGLPQAFAKTVVALDPPTWLFWVLIIVMFLILGCFMDPTSIIAITTPILLPIVRYMGIDPILYGIVLAVMIDIGFITPPVGMNLFTVNSVTGVPIESTVREIWPFVILFLVGTVFIILVPELALWLPATMK